VGRSVTRHREAGQNASGKGDDMTGSEQIDGLQAKVADRKNRLKPPGTKQNEQIKARPTSAEAKVRAAEETVHGLLARPGCRGTSTGRMPVQGVLSVRPRVASAQVERPVRPSSPLLTLLYLSRARERFH
jgi:hypothetical protein